jgi:proteasome lid subunit RPN8/RPN11
LRLPDVRIDREALTAIVAHARRDAPNECCGLLVGRPGEPASDSALRASEFARGASSDRSSDKGAGPHILEAVPTSNGASDPSRRYEISPVDYFAQIKRCRRISAEQSDTFAVLGAYHSHPRGEPDPSETDAAQAFRDFVFVIVGLGSARGGMEIRAYMLQEEKLAPVELSVTDVQA